MKTLKYIVLALVLSAFTINAADTTVRGQVVQTVKDEVAKAFTNAKDAVVTAANSETVKVAKTNLNTVMIDILSGVRDAGKEVYGASKEAIRSSVNFAQEQVPLVVKEFLKLAHG